MKVCYLANGSSIHIRKWIKYFANNGDDIRLFSFEQVNPMENVETRKLRYYSRIGWLLRIFGTRRTIKKQSPDILHAFYLSTYGMYAALTGHHPFVATVMGSDILIHAKSKLRKRLVKYVLEKADLITTDSETCFKKILGFGISEDKVKLIGHGVDTTVFKPTTEKEKLRRTLQLPLNHDVVVSTRNLEPIYDVATFIYAIPIILKEHPNTLFLIVGDGQERQQLEELTHKLSIQENVRFIGRVSNEEMPNYLGASDIYVSTALSDSTSVSLLEAMTCGLPTVVSDLEANREWIQNKVNGFLFPKRDVTELAESISFLFENARISQMFGRINRQIIKEQADYKQEMEKMKKLYDHLMEEHNWEKGRLINWKDINMKPKQS